MDQRIRQSLGQLRLTFVDGIRAIADEWRAATSDTSVDSPLGLSCIKDGRFDFSLLEHDVTEIAMQYQENALLGIIIDISALAKKTSIEIYYSYMKGKIRKRTIAFEWAQLLNVPPDAKMSLDTTGRIRFKYTS